MLCFCIVLYQRVMHQTFKEAFAEVENELEERMLVSYGLLNELHSRRVITHGQVVTIKVCVCHIFIANPLVKNSKKNPSLIFSVSHLSDGSLALSLLIDS